MDNQSLTTSSNQPLYFMLAYLVDQMKGASNELNELFQDIEKAKRIFDGLARNKAKETTREDYKARIVLFIQFVNESEAGFNYNSFNEYATYLNKQLIKKSIRINKKTCKEVFTRMSNSTKNKYYTAARVWLQQLNLMGFLQKDITINCPGWEQGEKHKRTGLNMGEVERVTKALNQLPDNAKSKRLKALFALLIYQGLRQYEVINLNIEDVNLNRSTALVLGKGRTEKESIDLHPKTVKTLKAYIENLSRTEGALFVNNSRSITADRLTTRGLRKVVKTIFGNLDIENSVHGLRHFFVTQLSNNDLLHDRDIIEYTRHKNTDMISVYKDENRKHKTRTIYYEVFNGIEL